MTYLTDVLESVDNEAFQGDAFQHFVVVNLDGVDCVEALDL